MIMRSSRGLLAALLGLLLALSGCTSFAGRNAPSAGSSPARGSAAAPAVPAKPVRWADCTKQITPLVKGQPGSDRQLTYSCGRLDVPIDYAHPASGTLPLFLLRVTLAGQTDRIGSLVVNPGGPGVSGADAAIGLAMTMPEDVLKRFDVVGFDPRGVALSTPVECIPDPLKEKIEASEPRPTTNAQLDAAFALARTVAGGCAKKYGDALGAFDTVDTARDMDLIRQAVGDRKITYLGYSYGTTLGSTYAELFPKNIRALVLDGVVDPDSTPQADAQASAAGLEKGFDAFAADCTHQAAACPVGKDPRAFVQSLLTRAAAKPIPSKKQGETRAATPGIVLTGVLSALYDKGSWPQLARALAAAGRGDSQGLFSLADSYSGRLDDGSYTNQTDANIAINCADTPQRFGENQVRALARAWNSKYPLFGAGAAVGLYTCTPWQADRTPLPKRKAVDTSSPVLVVGNTGDPVTPYPGAQDMARDLGDDVLLTWHGQGHTSYPKTPCVTKAVDAYLIALTPPKAGTTCPASG
jgi:pimeloyl-ACP methyl ester carboxylesterase